MQTFVFDIPESPTTTFQFKIQTPGKTLTVFTQKLQEKADWITDINEARDKQMEIEGKGRKDRGEGSMIRAIFSLSCLLGARMLFKLLKKEEEKQMLERLKSESHVAHTSVLLHS